VEACGWIEYPVTSAMGSDISSLGHLRSLVTDTWVALRSPGGFANFTGGELWLAANYHFSNGTASSPWLTAKTIAFNTQVGCISKVIDGT
jgi:hypothetical protein